MIEDKEYPVKVTDDMVTQYELMVYKVYSRYYSKYYSYLKQDLLQCGRWGIFLAYQRYERQNLKEKVEFDVFVWLSIHNKMWQYIDHEKHHITKDLDTEFDFNTISNTIDTTYEIDLHKAINKLSPREKDVVHKWCDGKQFKEMGYESRQHAHYYFKQSLLKMRKEIVSDEL